MTKTFSAGTPIVATMPALYSATLNVLAEPTRTASKVTAREAVAPGGVGGSGGCGDGGGDGDGGGGGGVGGGGALGKASVGMIWYISHPPGLQLLIVLSVPHSPSPSQ